MRAFWLAVVLSALLCPLIRAEEGAVRMNGGKRVKPFSCLFVRENEGCAPARENPGVWYSDDLQEAAKQPNRLTKSSLSTVSDVDFIPLSKDERKVLGDKCRIASDGEFCDVRKASITFADGHKVSNVFIFVPVLNIYEAVSGAFGPAKERYDFADLGVSGFSIKH